MEDWIERALEMALAEDSKEIASKADDLLNESTENFKKAQENIKEAIANSEAVKNGDIDLDDELNSNAYKLYDGIIESCVGILTNEEVKNRFVDVAKNMDIDAVQSFVELIAIIVSQSVYNSIVVYDGLLKGELSDQFGRFASNMNLLKSSVDAHESVLRVFKEKINKLESANTVEKFSKENNIPTEN